MYSFNSALYFTEREEEGRRNEERARKSKNDGGEVYLS